MNIAGIPTSYAAQTVRPPGGRFDVTLHAPAAPGEAGAPLPPGEAPDVGSIRGVLTPEENRAIAAAFHPGKGVYTAGGTPRPAETARGIHLDLRA